MDDQGKRYEVLADGSHTAQRCVFDRHRPADRQLICVAADAEMAARIATVMNLHESEALDAQSV
jgi:hypothetical protein